MRQASAFQLFSEERLVNKKQVMGKRAWQQEVLRNRNFYEETKAAIAQEWELLPDDQKQVQSLDTIFMKDAADAQRIQRENKEKNDYPYFKEES